MLARNQNHQRRGCIFNCITALARISGLITLIGLAFVTYLEWLSMESRNLRIYVTVVTGVIAYLELLWIFDKCIACCLCCFRSEACFYWTCCIPIDNWLKGLIYIGVSLPFLVPKWLLAYIRVDIKIVGILLVITGFLYFIKTFKYKPYDPDNEQEDDAFFVRKNSDAHPSISTQTSTTGINNDNPSSDLK